jgi:hypothetical protein
MSNNRLSNKIGPTVLLSAQAPLSPPPQPQSTVAIPMTPPTNDCDNDSSQPPSPPFDAPPMADPPHYSDISDTYYGSNLTYTRF